LPDSPESGVQDEKIPLFADFTLDLARGSLLSAGEPVHLRPLAFETLKYLVENRGRLVSKDSLVEAVWQGRAVTDDALVQCLMEVRRALGAEGKLYLRNVRGRGYIFDTEAGNSAPVEQIDVVRLVVEEEEADTITPAVPPVAESHNSATGSKRALALTAACLLIVSLLAGAAYYYSRPNSGKPMNAAGVKSLAVLPFKPLVIEGREEALEVGMADTLIAKLSNIGEVIVRPLSAVRRYGGLEQDPFAAGRELGVEAVLDGTIQRAGDRIRVTSRLVGVLDGRQLWEGRFDTLFTGIFSVQDSISEKVAASLKPSLTSVEERQLAKRYTENVEAYQLYLKGHYHFLTTRQSGGEIGISYYRQAIGIDPNYALAYAGISEAAIGLAFRSEMPSTEVFPEAKAAANKAVEIDNDLAEGQVAMGRSSFWYDWDWNAAENYFERALKINANHAEAHLAYGVLLFNTGRRAEGLARLRRSIELDPLNLRNNVVEGQYLNFAGRPDEALANLQKIFELEPNFYLAHLTASQAYIEKELFPEAIAAARAARKLNSVDSTPIAFLAYAFAKSGNQAEARSLLVELLKLAEKRYITPYNIALSYHGLGERDETLKWLKRGVEQRDLRMTFLKAEPKWDDLRSDARFQEIMRLVGLPQ
jgi:DNA-binding winged helix-turn-helix (wHTH) protein/TolB-like protein/tetratricopeptide (TPR) repeat protein